MVIIPLVVNPLGDRVYNLPKVFVLRCALLGALGFLIGCKLKAATEPVKQNSGVVLSKLQRHIPELLALGYLLCAGLATLFGIGPVLSLWGSYERIQGLATIACYVGLFLLLSNWVRSGQTVSRIAQAAVWGSLPISIYAILQQAGLQPIPIYQGYAEAQRSTGTFGTPTALGAYLAMVAPVALALLLSASGALSRLLFGGLLLQLVALATTLSRSGWIGVAAGLAMVTVLSLMVERRRNLKTFVLVTMAILVGLSGLLIASGMLTRVEERLNVLLLASAGTGGLRLELWRAAASALAARPWLGYGPDAYGFIFEQFYPDVWISYEGPWVLFDRAHNQFLDTALAIGLPGLVAYLGLILGTAGLGIRTATESSDREHRVLVMGLSGGVTAYLVSNLFNFGTVPIDTVLWTFLALLLVLSRQERREMEIRAALSSIPIFNPKGKRWAYGFAFAGIVVAAASFAPVLAADVAYARAWEQTNRVDTTAFDTFNEAIQLLPGEAHYYEGFSDVLIATARNGQWRSQRELMQAIDLLQQAILLQPLNPQLHVKLATAQAQLAAMGNPEQLALAETAYDRAVQLAPRRPVYRQSWGDALLLNGKAAEAVAHYELVIESGQVSPSLYLNYGEALRGVGRLSEAEAAMATYQRLLSSTEPVTERT
ncbi:MAG: O-antigen ligase family protein, partial [Chloroflexota bacterium]